jgi:hypothetical protein
MNEPLDDAYLTWLYSQIGSVKLKNRARSYWRLARKLYTIEFVWLVPNDDNRVEDGRDLRFIFLEESGMDVDTAWMDLGCSFLEMLIGLSRRLSFEAEGEPRDWFWHLMDTLELRECNDRANWPDEHVEEICSRVIFRTYAPDGVGGLFPLQHPQKDQRNVELWYQMSAYLLEHAS